MTPLTRLKTSVIGRPLATHEEEHQLLPKRLALPVFASDPLSSVAYATEEAMLVLAIAGASAFSLIGPVAAAVGVLLAIVVMSYRQTIRAYPDGGGAFIVASENLGIGAGAVAASALLIDYTLTVSVSVAAGVAAITSAMPSLLGARVWFALGFVALLTVANLRGVKEASTLFALPTYLFVATVLAMLGVGFAKCMDGVCPTAVSSGAEISTELGTVGLFLILRAFASGSTALTGVEAIANGVQAFRHPKSRNAITTLTVMGGISITMLLGISGLAHAFGVRPSEENIDQYGTVISQIGRAAFGDGWGFWLLQAFTAAILVLAANTAYQDFPRLSAILADHRLMPRQFRNRGDRLVFSNGVIVLALLASALLVLFDAQVSRLIQLYVVGVFTSFTLSQAGMVRHWVVAREPGWRRSVVVNAVGSVTTGVVLVVVATVKFTHGAWIVLAAMPLLVGLMLAMRRHYRSVATQLKSLPTDIEPRRNLVMVLVSHTDESTERALRFSDLLSAEQVEYVHAEEFDSDDLIHAWKSLYPGRPLTVLGGERQSVAQRIVEHARCVRRDNPGHMITVVTSERFRRRRPFEVISNPNALAIKARLLFEPSVAVADLTLIKSRRRRGLTPVPLRRLETVVLISDLTRPIREALGYAARLGAPMSAVHVDVEDRQRARVVREWYPALAAWAVAGEDVSLEVVPSPYRGIVEPLVSYLRERRRLALPGTVINVVLPEFIVPGRVAQILHNQTALAIKGALAREPGIAVTSVPFHLEEASIEAAVS